MLLVLLSNNDLVLMTQHSSFPSCASVRARPSQYHPEGRRFESRLKFIKFFCKGNGFLCKVKSSETCGDL
ncbi:MAG: hypothetical protein PV344_02370 [Anaplasma sp.]|nr:hypothetical protein [Anaplasma sp.]